MIDSLSLALSHGLMILAAWLLLRRSDLDREDGGMPGQFGGRFANRSGRRDKPAGKDRPGA